MHDDLSEAVRYHQQGQLEQAAQLYQQFLARYPDHPDALHLLGVIAFQQGDCQQAIERISRALVFNPAPPPTIATLPKPIAWAAKSSAPSPAPRWRCGSSPTIRRHTTISAWRGCLKGRRLNRRSSLKRRCGCDRTRPCFTTTSATPFADRGSSWRRPSSFGKRSNSTPIKRKRTAIWASCSWSRTSWARH